LPVVRGAAVFVTTAALLAAGCSGHRSGPSAAPTQASAARLVVQQTDLPAGWTARPHSPDPAVDQEAAAIAACLHVPSPDRQVTVDGDDLRSATGPTSFGVRSRAAFVRTAASVRAVAKAARGDRFHACVKKEATALLVARVSTGTVTNVRVADLSVPHHGDTTVAYRLTATITASSQEQEVVADSIVYTRGRAEIAIGLTGVGAPVPSGVERAVLDAVGTRLDRL
jgi:hypothetical protein